MNPRSRSLNRNKSLRSTTDQNQRQNQRQNRFEDKERESDRKERKELMDEPNMVTSNVYQFKIALKGVKPKVWRRIQVPDKYSFWDLHIAIQDAMGWRDCHLHQFAIQNPKTGARDLIGRPDALMEDVISGKSAKIAEYFLSPKDKANYEYDFGDGWEHTVTLESILPAVTENKYPKCTAGKRACPPEDCGGVWGYENLLEIIANPDHEEYEDRMEWLENLYPNGFNPADFDPKLVEFDNPEER